MVLIHPAEGAKPPPMTLEQAQIIAPNLLFPTNLTTSANQSLFFPYEWAEVDARSAPLRSKGQDQGWS